LPHHHGVLNGNGYATDYQHDSEVLVPSSVVSIAVFVEYWTSEDKASENTELDGFVEAVPDAVNAEADVKESRGQPSEPHDSEEF
jgi:hypothetical protein